MWKVTAAGFMACYSTRKYQKIQMPLTHVFEWTGYYRCHEASPINIFGIMGYAAVRARSQGFVSPTSELKSLQEFLAERVLKVPTPVATLINTLVLDPPGNHLRFRL